jgi:hypothetical protein
MVLTGAFLTWPIFGVRLGASFLMGGVLAGVSMAWLRHTVNSMVFHDRRRSITRVIGGFILRLMLIPLCLYAMIRFLYVGIIAAVGGFAVFNCSIFVEGLHEALKSSRNDPGTK